ncbi:hypothetical protein CSUI_002204 [Cystoisospora suis]|uniref:Transmembrane protein n=1 Tax=Cystoisospora suis TaxID=483139 RepID=A0A2C6LA44_9APIC|nr:hypothetical protein CSUI_002204 [Cystoisospora suis]
MSSSYDRGMVAVVLGEIAVVWSLYEHKGTFFFFFQVFLLDLFVVILPSMYTTRI